MQSLSDIRSFRQLMNSMNQFTKSQILGNQCNDAKLKLCSIWQNRNHYEWTNRISYCVINSVEMTSTSIHWWKLLSAKLCEKNRQTANSHEIRSFKRKTPKYCNSIYVLKIDVYQMNACHIHQKMIDSLNKKKIMSENVNTQTSCHYLDSRRVLCKDWRLFFRLILVEFHCEFHETHTFVIKNEINFFYGHISVSHNEVKKNRRFSYEKNRLAIETFSIMLLFTSSSVIISIAYDFSSDRCLINKS